MYNSERLCEPFFGEVVKLYIKLARLRVSQLQVERRAWKGEAA